GGFPGYVTSDGGGLQMLYRTHGVAADAAEAARKALPAGVDFDLSDGSVYRTLVQQVKEGKVSISEVDRAVGRVLAAKFRLGLFENPYVDPDYAEKTTNSTERSEERRVGKECRYRRWRNDSKKKTYQEREFDVKKNR